MLGDEEVGTFDDVLEVRLALGIEETSDVRDVNGLRSDIYRLVCSSFCSRWNTLTVHHKARTNQP